MVKILIIGGGIAGLSMARLLQDNYEVHLVEKQNEWQISGTGLYTPSNGVLAMEKMGVIFAKKKVTELIPDISWIQLGSRI